MESVQVCRYTMDVEQWMNWKTCCLPGRHFRAKSPKDWAAEYYDGEGQSKLFWKAWYVGIQHWWEGSVNSRISVNVSKRSRNSVSGNPVNPLDSSRACRSEQLKLPRGRSVGLPRTVQELVALCEAQKKNWVRCSYKKHARKVTE